MSLSMGVVILIIALPFIFIPQVFNPYESPKFIFFVAGVEILVLHFVWVELRKNKLDLPKINIGVILILGFGLVNLISNIFGVDTKVSLLGSSIRHQGFLTLISGVILFLLVRFSFREKSYLFFKKAVLICAFLLSLIALWQVLAINVFHNYSIPTYDGRVVGTMGNPNFLGGYLAMLLPFALFDIQKNPKSILFRVIIVSTILVAIFFTNSRSSFIATVFILVGYSVYLLRKTVLSKVLVGVVLLFLVFGIIQSVSLFTTKIALDTESSLSDQEVMCHAAWPQFYPLKYLTDMQTNNILSKRASFCDSRLLVWLMGTEAVLKRPILGFGQDNFELAVQSGKMHVVDNSHNVFLETAVSSGILGLLLYIAIIFYFLKKAFVWEIRFSIIAFLIVAQFNPLSIVQIALFWVLLGVTSSEQKG